MIYPLNNLPVDSRKWGRFVETTLDDNILITNQNAANIASLNKQVFGLNIREEYFTPAVYTNSITKSFLGSSILTIGAYSIKVLGAGILITAGFKAQVNVSSTGQYAYMYFKLLNSSGADTLLLTSDTFVRAEVGQFSFTSASETFFVPVSAGNYTLIAYASGITAGNTYTVDESFVSIQQIKTLN
jgi:hypothetical protein